MAKVAFVNHLRLGSASSFRQAGLAKYLARLGMPSEFLGREGHSVINPGDVPAEWRCFEKVRFWREPLTPGILENVRLLRSVAGESSLLHVNRANPYTATVVALGKPPTKKLVVDMEDWDGFGGYSTYAGFYGARGGLLTLYEDAFPRRGDLVLAVSHLLAGRMLQLGVPRDKLMLVPNGYDEELFDPSISGDAVRAQYGLDDSPVVIYMSTYWRFEKQLHEIALKAFKEVSRDHPDARLLMVGGGDLDVRALVSEYGMDGVVVPTGFVSRKAIPSLIAAADVALHVISDHPFHRASSPMVMPEYMAMAKPIVAPRIGELAYALQGGAGWLVDAADPKLLAAGVNALLDDETARREMGQRAFARVKEEYSYGKLALRLKIAYERICAQ